MKNKLNTTSCKINDFKSISLDFSEFNQDTFQNKLITITAEAETDDFSQKIILSFDLQCLLARKGLKENTFESINCTITLDTDIKAHAAWAFQHIYAYPYPEQIIHEENIARFHHGIQHVSRAAMYAPVFANLYRRYGHYQALQLTNEQLKLIQIALLFHDAAREDEEEDLWDHESAAFLYFYLTRILKISVYQAKELAEAVANKDWAPGEHYIVLHEIESEVIWSLERKKALSINIYHKLIHDSDCLDIIRARDAFKGKKLNFYQDIVSLSKKNTTLDEIAELIIRARSLIEIQGDARSRTKPMLKKHYENENSYSAILQDIHNGNYTIFKALYANGKLLSAEKLAKLTLIDPNNILNQQKILARGMIVPSAFAEKYLTNKESKESQPETLANLEFRKTKRRKGILSNTSKSNGLNKEGNPYRSVSLLGNSVFVDAGCLIFNPDKNAVKAIYAIDADTGWGKKQTSCTNINSTTILPTQKDLITNVFPAEITFDELETKMKLGSSVRFFKGRKHPASFNEILYNVTKYDAIYYTFDPVSANELFHGNPENTVPYAPILKAIYLQFAYQEAFNGEILPIYEYSGIHHYLKKVSPFTEEQISHMWLEMCENFMMLNSLNKLSSYSISTIMMLSMYKKIFHNEVFREITDACHNYPEHLALKIKKEVRESRDKFISEHKNRIAEKLHHCIDDLISSSNVTNEISQELISTFKLAKKAELRIVFLARCEIYEFLSNSLAKIHQENNRTFYENSFKLASIAWGIGIVSFLKDELSQLKYCRWSTYHSEKFNPDIPISVFDLSIAIQSMCNGLIDLTYMNIIEISNGKNSSVVYLNDLFRDASPYLKERIDHFFKSASNNAPALKSEIITNNSSIGFGTFFHSVTIHKNTDIDEPIAKTNGSDL